MMIYIYVVSINFRFFENFLIGQLKMGVEIVCVQGEAQACACAIQICNRFGYDMDPRSKCEENVHLEMLLA